MRQRSVLGLSLALVLAVCFTANAESWNLLSDVGGSITNPVGTWSFETAGNPQDWGTNIDIDPTAYAPIANSDFSAGDDRVMWFYTAGNAWSTPAVRIYDYSDDVNRSVRLWTLATQDVIVKWTSPVSGDIAINGLVQDLDTNGGTGYIRISKYAGSGDDDNVIKDVAITDNATVPDEFSATVSVEIGDVIYFRKTHYKYDDYGCTNSLFDVTISTVTAWDLITDLGGAATNPTGRWSFLTAGNPQDWGTNIDVDPTAYALIPYLDYSASADRLMWYSVEGNAWSTPAFRVYNYSDDATRTARLMTTYNTDVIVQWTSPITGNVMYNGSVIDGDTNNGTGVIRISHYYGTAADSNVLENVSITNNATTADLFEGTVFVNAGEILYFRNTFYKWDNYGCNNCNLTLTISAEPETEAPVFTPDSAVISGPTSITLSCPTAGADIYYTLDGSKPTSSSNIYSTPVLVNAGDTLKAIAVAGDTSWVSTRTYTYAQADAPEFSYPGMYIPGSTDVTITTTSAGASIYYTTNGNDPTTSDTLYTGPVTVSDGTVLKAIAGGQYYLESDITSVSYEVPYGMDRIETIPFGSVTVDGDLSDWDGSTWAPMDMLYSDGDDGDGDVEDISSAQWSAKWNDGKIYVAVKVEDTAHFFTDSYTNWNARDAIEIFVHTDNNNDSTYANAISAQQYIVGFKNSDPTSVWTALYGAGVSVLESGGSTFDGVGVAAGSVDGNWLYYELELTPFSYLGYMQTGDLTTSTVTTLDGGEIIGLDVNAASHNGTEFTGVRSENMYLMKHIDWTQFGFHQLGDAPDRLAGDANEDGSVDVGDLGILAANYGTASGASWGQGDFNGDGAVDVGDLGILAANYGTNSSSADFDADYAKVFGEEADEVDESSVCALFGLPLIAGLLMIGLMLVKLED